jgi:hypothetical protein
VSLTYKASELHRSHNVTDSLALNTVIQWTVALTPVFGTSTEEQELDNWATFQLVRLKALHETDVMDIPTRFMLEPARPNPFNPSTSLRIHIPNASHLSLMVFDIIGRPVNTIHEGSISAGVHDLDWNAGRLSSGIYIVRARLEGTVLTQSVTLLK